MKFDVTGLPPTKAKIIQRKIDLEQDLDSYEGSGLKYAVMGVVFSVAVYGLLYLLFGRSLTENLNPAADMGDLLALIVLNVGTGGLIWLVVYKAYLTLVEEPMVDIAHEMKMLQEINPETNPKLSLAYSSLIENGGSTPRAYHAKIVDEGRLPVYGEYQAIIEWRDEKASENLMRNAADAFKRLESI